MTGMAWPPAGTVPLALDVASVQSQLVHALELTQRARCAELLLPPPGATVSNPAVVLRGEPHAPRVRQSSTPM